MIGKSGTATPREAVISHGAANHRTCQKRNPRAESVRNLFLERCFDVRLNGAVHDRHTKTRFKEAAKPGLTGSVAGPAEGLHKADKREQLCPSWTVRSNCRSKLLRIDFGFGDRNKTFQPLVDPDLDRQAKNVVIQPPSRRITQTLLKTRISVFESSFEIGTRSNAMRR